MLRRLYFGLGVMVLGAIGLALVLFAGDWLASFGNGRYGVFMLVAFGLWGGGIAYLLTTVRYPG
jgi:hypothetical protein